jgi:hypothetical protein
MLLEIILDEYKECKHNYIKQYDAMLCYGTEANFDPVEGKSWLQYLQENASGAFDYVGKKIGFLNPQIDGLNFMEVADAGDLHGHLFSIQKERFSTIRGVEDITPDTFGKLSKFLDGMIKQLLRPLSILRHPKCAFIHGDLKTKNIFC